MLQIRGLQLNHFGGFLRDRGNLCISGSMVTQSLHRRGILNIDGSGRFRNKNLFPDFFFLKKERQVTICLAYFVCACIYRNSLGGGAVSCNEAEMGRWLLWQRSLSVAWGKHGRKLLERAQYVAAPACSYQELRASGAEGRKHNDLSMDSYLNTSDILWKQIGMFLNINGSDFLCSWCGAKLPGSHNPSGYQCFWSGQQKMLGMEVAARE